MAAVAVTDQREAIPAASIQADNDLEQLPQLPPEVVAVIIGNLDEVADLCHAAQVSRQWRAEARGNAAAWQRVYEREFAAALDDSDDDAEATSWRQTYL